MRFENVVRSSNCGNASMTPPLIRHLCTSGCDGDDDDDDDDDEKNYLFDSILDTFIDFSADIT
jgi:hypothetical protein